MNVHILFMIMRVIKKFLMQFLVHKLNIKKFFFSFFYFPTNLIFFVIFIPSTDFIAFPLPCIDFPEKKNINFFISLFYYFFSLFFTPKSNYLRYSAADKLHFSFLYTHIGIIRDPNHIHVAYMFAIH